MGNSTRRSSSALLFLFWEGSLLKSTERRVMLPCPPRNTLIPVGVGSLPGPRGTRRVLFGPKTDPSRRFPVGFFGETRTNPFQSIFGNIGSWALDTMEDERTICPVLEAYIDNSWRCVFAIIGSCTTKKDYHFIHPAGLYSYRTSTNLKQ